MQTYNKIKTSRALAGLPSHISSAKAAQLFQQPEENFQQPEENIEDKTEISYQAKVTPQSVPSHPQETKTKDRDRFEQPKPRERQRADVFGPMVMTQKNKDKADTLNRPKTASQKQRSNYGPQGSSYSSPDDHNSTKKACYQAEHLYLPVLAACLVSCVLGWLIRDQLTDNKEVIALRGETEVFLFWLLGTKRKSVKCMGPIYNSLKDPKTILLPFEVLSYNFLGVEGTNYSCSCSST